MISYKYVYAGCGAGQYSILTHAHSYLNFWVLPGPVPKPMKVGFYPTHYGYFCGYPTGLGPIAKSTFKIL